MKTRRCLARMLLFLGVVLVVGAGRASALTITQTQTFSGTPNFDPVLTFSKWSNNGYSLQSIEIIMLLQVSEGNLSVDNDGAGPATVTVRLGADGKLTSSDVTILNGAYQGFPTVNASGGATYNLSADDGDGQGVQFGGTDWATYTGTNISATDSFFVNSQFFSGYSGTGTYNLFADINQILDFGGVGGVSGSFSPVLASGSVTVKYTDNAPVPPAVPEPSTMLLVGSGIAGMWCLRRKRKVLL